MLAIVGYILPLYAQVSHAGRHLHLSENHGDATPGGASMIAVDNVRTYCVELLTQRHRKARPGIEENPRGRTMTVLDTFGNRLVFWRPERW